MSPVDGIRPPKKKKPSGKVNKKTAKKTALPNKKNPNKPTPPPIRKPASPSIPPEKKDDASRPLGTEKVKELKLWSLVAVVAILIIIGWIVVFPPGHTSSDGSYWNIITNKASSLWDTIKTDILKFKEENLGEEATITNDEQIDQLEDQIFPQFDDPTNQ